MTGRRRSEFTFSPDALGTAQRAISETSLHEVLTALVNGWCLSAVVPIALARVERDPLVSAGSFDGDLMRGLMEVSGAFWGRHPRLYDRYRAALRQSAAMRRRLPAEERMRFWSPIESPREPPHASEDEVDPMRR
jgi:hypothetical protein